MNTELLDKYHSEFAAFFDSYLSIYDRDVKLTTERKSAHGEYGGAASIYLENY